MSSEKSTDVLEMQKFDSIIVNTLGELRNPNIAALSEDPPYVRGSTDPDDHRRDIDLRAIREAHQSGLTAVNITIANSSADFAQTVREIGAWEQLIRSNTQDFVKVLSADDIVTAKQQGKIGVIFGLQNLDQIGREIERIDTYNAFGVRILQLTYNPANLIGGGATSPGNEGLSEFGRQVIERLNERRIIVDLSHSGYQTCLDAAEASRRPISISHTGCRDLCDMPRNKSDKELRLVASKGGYIGIYFMAYLKSDWHPCADDVVAHIDHAVNVCGEDHVGIGTDGPVTQIDDLVSYEIENAKEIAKRIAEGIGGGEQSADTFPFVVDLRGVKQFYRLAELLAKKGYRSSTIEKILGKNFIRYAEDVWGT
jgi:membrane dipeptidase